MQKVRCACCNRYLGRHKIPDDGWVESYCDKKHCKCHTRVERVNGLVSSRLVDVPQQKFASLVPSLV